MVVCKFFMQGTCKFGNSCRFDHQINDNSQGSSILRQTHQNNAPGSTMNPNDYVQSVIGDMRSAEQGKQWVFSAYTPFNDKPKFPGFEDKSFEEIRAGYYEAQKNGTVEQYKQMFRVWYEEALGKIKMLQNPTEEIVKVLTLIYNAPDANQPFSSPGIFGGGTQNNTSVFGQNLFGKNPQNNNNNNKSIFGQNSNSIFGNSSIFNNQKNQSPFSGQNNTQPSPFGNQTQSNLFNNPVTQSSVFNNPLFNKPTTQSSPFNSPLTQGSIFNKPTIQTSPFNNPTNQSTPFNNPTITQSSVFNNPPNQTISFNNPTNQPTPFNNPNNQPTPFNNPTNQPTPFNNPTNQPTPFNNPNNQPTPFNNPTTQSIPFGNNPTVTLPSVSENNAMNTSQTPPINPLFQQGNISIFGGNPIQVNNQSNTQPAQSIFAQNPVVGNSILNKSPNTNVFGGMEKLMEVKDEGWYSKLEELSEEDVKSFEAEKFDFGKIPENPPTLQMCF